MSKGSRPRPFSIPLEELGNRHEQIFGKKVKEQYVPPPLPPELLPQPKDEGKDNASKS